MAAQKSPKDRYSQDSIRSDGSFIGFSQLEDDIPKTEQPIPASPEVKTWIPPVGPYVKEYKMDHPYRGKVIVFNHENYVSGLKLPIREGTAVDEKNIKRSFMKLCFEVEILKDMHYDEIMKKLKEESKNEQLNDSDCIVIVILTHGINNGLIYAFDRLYDVDEVWNHFKADECPGLAGKPKIFIIQACRGDVPSAQFPKVQQDSRPADFKEDEPYRIPAEADILIAYSTFPGRVAHRDIETGTWFIDELCKELDYNQENEDFLSLLTSVNRFVAVTKEYKNRKQMPVIQSTLTRKLFFNKSEQNDDLDLLKIMLEKMDAKVDRISQSLEAKPMVPGIRPFIRKPVTTIRWDGLRDDSKVSLIALPDDIAVHKLASGLQLFLKEEHLLPEIRQEGEMILRLLAAWPALEEETRCFGFERLAVFLNMHAKNWKVFPFLDIPTEFASQKHCRRWSNSSEGRKPGSLAMDGKPGSLPRFGRKK